MVCLDLSISLLAWRATTDRNGLACQRRHWDDPDQHCWSEFIVGCGLNAVPIMSFFFNQAGGAGAEALDDDCNGQVSMSELVNLAKDWLYWYPPSDVFAEMVSGRP